MPSGLPTSWLRCGFATTHISCSRCIVASLEAKAVVAAGTLGGEHSWDRCCGSAAVVLVWSSHEASLCVDTMTHKAIISILGGCNLA